MAVRPVRLFGDPVLTTVAQPVTEFNAELEKLVTDMIDTMRAEDGVGLAAPQVGVSLRVFVYEVDGELGHIINPELEFPDDEIDLDIEGCLSIPELRYDVPRYYRTIARGVDMHGDPLEVSGEELLARCLQHETDHLDGILFLDRLSKKDRRAAMAEIRQAEWNNTPVAPGIFGSGKAFLQA